MTIPLSVSVMPGAPAAIARRSARGLPVLMEQRIYAIARSGGRLHPVPETPTVEAVHLPRMRRFRQRVRARRLVPPMSTPAT